MEQVIVKEGGQQVVTGSHRMGIPGQMKVDILHRKDLSTPPTRTASLHPKYRTERGLPERKRGAMPKSREPHGQAYRRRRLSLSQRRGIDRRDEDISPFWGLCKAVQYRWRNFCLISPIAGQFFGTDPQLSSNVEDWTSGHGLSDFEVSQETFIQLGLDHTGAEYSIGIAQRMMVRL